MVNFMKVDFQARLYKKKNEHCLDKAVFFYETFEIATPDNKSVMRASE